MIASKLIFAQVSKEWSKCVNEKIKLPIPNINIFEENGNFKEKMVFEWTEPTIIEEESEEMVEILQKEKDEDDQIQTIEEEESEEIVKMVHKEKDKDNQKQKKIVPTPGEYSFTSSTTKMIFNVIGLTNDLKAYDKHHTIFKNKKLESSRKICQKILPPIQKTTKKIVKESEANLAQWEKKFFATNNEIPSIIDIKNGPAEVYLNKIRYGKQLLKLWNLY